MSVLLNRSRLLVCLLIALSGSLLAQGLTPSAAGRPSKVPARSSDAVQSGAPGSRVYIIGNDDLLAINVWKEPDLTRSIPVRSDGKISLPLVGEIQAAGKTPMQLGQQIAARLRSYVAEPYVTVMVEQINSKKFNILGQVAKPGTYSLTQASTIVDAIALAGGFKDFAKRKDIYVLRQNPDGSVSRLAFNYKKFLKGKDPAQNIRLQPNDTIAVR
ncbi:MAG: polysaccharide biosynthesis/export family protein [Acidobacteriaceae bacterium]